MGQQAITMHEPQFKESLSVSVLLLCLIFGLFFLFFFGIFYFFYPFMPFSISWLTAHIHKQHRIEMSGRGIKISSWLAAYFGWMAYTMAVVGLCVQCFCGSNKFHRQSNFAQTYTRAHISKHIHMCRYTYVNSYKPVKG